MSEIQDHQRQLNHQFILLGKLVVQHKSHQGPKTIMDNPDIKRLLEECHQLQIKLLRLRQNRYELDEKTLDDQMNRLKQTLAQQGMTITELTLTGNSPWMDHPIKEMGLPSDVLILCVQKNKRVVIAKGDTKLNEQDTVFLLGPEAEIRKITEELQTESTIIVKKL